MVVGAVSARTEVAVVGGGPGGYTAALRAADAGLEVTLIERHELGGVCLNVGCIPSKTLIETADLRWKANTAGDRGLAGSLEVDVSGVRAHLDAVRRSLRAGVGSLLADAGVSVLEGTARFMRRDRLVIEHDGAVEHLEFDHAIVATGSRSVELPSLPFGAGVVDSTGALALESLPSHVVVVGAGYIGIELGTALAKLGSEVTVIESADRILPALPDPLTAPVASRLFDLGVDVRTGRDVTTRTETGVVLDDGTALTAALVVVAVGRRPNGDTCGLDAIGARIDADGYVVVGDDLLATSQVYAIGDVIRGPALAHRATADAERVVAHLTGQPHVQATVVPAIVYADPEIMTVGVWPTSSLDGLEVHRFPHAASARARTIGTDRGATFVVADPAGTVVGIHAVGSHVSELAGEAALAVEMAATLQDISSTVHPHPTMSESVAEAALLGMHRPLHVRR